MKSPLVRSEALRNDGEYAYGKYAHGQLGTVRQDKKLCRVRSSRGSLAEFAPALFLFGMLLFIPALTFMQLGLRMAAVNFVMARAADAAAKAPNVRSASARANEVLTTLLATPLARLTGVNQAAVSEISVYVDEHVTATGITNIYAANDVLPKAISPAINVYEYDLRASYWLEPILKGAHLPFLSEVPLLGTNLRLTVRDVRAVELPKGIVDNSSEL